MLSWLPVFPLLLSLFILLLTYGIGLMLWTSKSKLIEKNYDIEPKVSILMPCFNEGQGVIPAIESLVINDYPTEKIEVIAIDDCSSDDTYHWLEKAAEQWPNVRVFKNPVNRGKHHTLCSALSRSSGEILICIDSDSIFDKRAIRELTACFVDETIGGVGGRVAVSNTSENIWTQCQTFIYYCTFQFSKITQNWVTNINCISGCMFAIRREHFEAIKEQIAQRNWFGIGVRDGEDRHMTHLLLLKGLKTCLNIDACCWTAVPNNFKELFMQQLRWRRGMFRNFFWVIRNLDLYLKMIHPIGLIVMLIPMFFSLLKPVAYMYLVLSPGWLTAESLQIQITIAVNILLGVFINIHMSINNSKQKINPLAASVAILWFVTDAILTILALATLDIGEWGTREVAPQQRL